MPWESRLVDGAVLKHRRRCFWLTAILLGLAVWAAVELVVRMLRGA
jgi:hypothetical protein